MKILHTSDWHLGGDFFGHKRNEEYEDFLLWLSDLIEKEHVDALLIAGDIFDTVVPNHKAQKQYYDFLAGMVHSCCRDIIVIAGNHDSPSFLNAQSDILRNLNIHIVGSVSEDHPDEEVIVLYDTAKHPCAIVCAVPYIRESDLREFRTDEDSGERTDRQVNGIKDHYQKIASLAEQKRNELREIGMIDTEIPIIAMGHLFTEGGKTIDGDGVRDIRIGSLGCVDVQAFPSTFDYVALGHLHIPQIVAKNERIRYCGSPLPVGFGERDQEKKIVLIDFDGSTPKIELKTIPQICHLIQISGDLDQILEKIEELRQTPYRIWLAIEFTGSDPPVDLVKRLEDAVENTEMIICKTERARKARSILCSDFNGISVSELDEIDVFRKRLEQSDFSEDDKGSMMDLYEEVLRNINENDRNAT